MFAKQTNVDYNNHTERGNTAEADTGDTMTKTERHTTFNALFESIPLKKNADKIRVVCSILYCAPITVRQWRMKNPPRVPSEKMVLILQRELNSQN